MARMERAALDKPALCRRGDKEQAVEKVRKKGEQWTPFCAYHVDRSVERHKRGL